MKQLNKFNYTDQLLIRAIYTILKYENPSWLEDVPDDIMEMASSYSDKTNS